jgi:hypothetical protein
MMTTPRYRIKIRIITTRPYDLASIHAPNGDCVDDVSRRLCIAYPSKRPHKYSSCPNRACIFQRTFVAALFSYAQLL